MKLIELHILQSFPVSCLNRDDLGSPKTAVFGGTTRARISSQCLKRAARVYARENSQSGRFRGIRSRFVLEEFAQALKTAGLAEEKISETALELAEVFSTLEEKKKNAGDVTTAIFVSPDEVKEIAELIAAGEPPAKAAVKAKRLDAADIALFGRMIASSAALTLEGAAMFSHALSTHASVAEVDFFAAVDDKGSSRSGVSMIGTLEFGSATYYRYCGINLDLLAQKSHLGFLTRDERAEVLEDFLKAVLLSVPGGRRHSMNAATLPHAVLGVVKNSGHPLQLVNAFENPVAHKAGATGGYANISAEKLKAHHMDLKRTWGLKFAAEEWMPDKSLGEFTETLLKNA